MKLAAPRSTPPFDATGRRERWARVIFPESPPATLDGIPRFALLVALFTAGFFLVMLRIPRDDWNVLWAEDGIVFLTDALLSGFVSIVEPYAGYLHVAPRLLSLIASIAPLEFAPAVLTALAAATVSALACAVFTFMETRLTSIPLRFGAWLVACALPIMGGEVLGSVANLHWYFMIAAFCAATTAAPSRRTAAVQAIVLCLAVLSDPLTLMLIPLLVARWWLRRGRADAMVLIAFAIAGTVQVAATFVGSIFLGDRVVSSTRPSVLELFEFFGIRAVATGALGISGTETADAWVGDALAWIAMSVLTLLVVTTALVGGLSVVPSLVFLLGAAGFAVVAWSLQWEFISAGGPMLLGVGDRYSVVPAALVVLAILLAADGLLLRMRAPSLRLLAALGVLVAIMIPAVIDARVWSFRADAPSWRDQLVATSHACAGGEQADFTATIAPASMGMYVSLPCRLLDGVP